MAKEKKNIEFSNFIEFRDSKPEVLPKILCFISQDSFEFEQVVDYYREQMKLMGEAFEGIVFTGESGEVDSFFSHVFTPDMFFPTKLLIIKSGIQFFKPFFSAASKKPNDLFQNFTHQLPQFSDKVYIVFHYDNWEMPAGVKKLFNNELTVIHSKNFYSNQTRQNLERLLRQDELTMSTDAMDEFIYRVPANMGSYMKSIQKLRVYLNKKKFDLEDVQNILFSRTTINYNDIANLFFQNRRAEFFKEITKITDMRAELGIILIKLLDRLNELRIYRIFNKKFHGQIPEDELFQVLGMQAYSSGRKYHIKKELVSESRYLKDKTIEVLYNYLIDLNLKHKFNSDNDGLKLVVKQKFLNMFASLEH
jgi:DNA polymerase III subunit delta